jgi:hypothetical protein
MKFFRIILVVSFVAGILVSCTKDYFDLKKLSGGFWNPDVAVPLVDSYLSLNDILSLSDRNGNFQVGSDNFITLVYRDNLFSLMAKDFIQIPDPASPVNLPSISVPQSVISGFNALNLIDSVPLPSFTSTINFSVAPHNIQSMNLQSGVLALRFNSTVNTRIRVRINFPSITRNGLLQSVTGVIPASQGSPVTSVVSVDLSNSIVNLVSTLAPGTSGIDYQVQMWLLKDSPTSQISGTPSLSGDLTYTQLKFKSLFGTFDLSQQQLAPYIDSVAITLFNNVAGQSNFELANPSLTFNIRNSFGIPFKGQFEVLSGFNSKTLSNVIIDLPDTMEPFNVRYPLFSEIGQTKLTSYTLSNQTSNIAAVLNSNPNFLIYKVKNLPAVNPPGNTNFVEDTSRFKLDMEINLPLEGRVNGLVFQDTIPFTFRDVQELRELELRTFITNGFPIDVKMNVYFADANNSIIAKLYETDAEPIIVAASTDASGKSVTPGYDETSTVVPFSLISKLGNVSKIFVKAVTATTDAASGKNIKLYSDYRIDVKISGRAKLSFDL